MNEVTQDETSGFITESEDAPVVEELDQDEAKEGEANPDNDDTESEETEEESTDNEDKEDDSIADDTSAEPVKKKKTNKVQERINEVVRQREDEKRKREALEKRVQELEGKTKQIPTKEPQESDFDSYSEYLDALDEYDKRPDSPESNKEIPTLKGKVESKSEGDTLTDNQRSAMAIIRENIDADDSKPTDFNEVALSPDVHVTGDMLEAIAECENPAAVMYHLGKNKGVAGDIANKTPAQQIVAIAKLDVQVSRVRAKPMSTTNAPDPINPVRGGDTHRKPLSRMTFEEFEAADRARNRGGKSTW